MAPRYQHSTEMASMRVITVFAATLATASAFMAPASLTGLTLRSPAICSVRPRPSALTLAGFGKSISAIARVPCRGPPPGRFGGRVLRDARGTAFSVRIAACTGRLALGMQGSLPTVGKGGRPPGQHLCAMLSAAGGSWGAARLLQGVANGLDWRRCADSLVFCRLALLGARPWACPP